MSWWHFIPFLGSIFQDTRHLARRNSRKVVVGSLVAIGASVVIVAPWTSPGQTANLWIDANGGTCTRQASAGAYVDAAACGGIVTALAASTGGDTVRIRPGSYSAAVITTTEKATAVTFAGSGIDTTTISNIETQDGTGGYVFTDMTLGGYYNRQHTNNVTYRNVKINSRFFIRGSSNITWDHVEATIPGSTTVPDSNFISSNYASSGAQGSSNITIKDSYIHHYRRATGTSDHVDCIAADDIDGFTVQRTRFEDCEAFSIIFGRDNGTGRGARNVLLENNIFNMHSNNSSGFYNVCFTKVESNVVVRYNSFDTQGVSECELLSTDGSVTMLANAGLSNNSLNCSNNLFVWSKNVFPSNACTGGVNSNPLFVSSSTGDFTLQAGSPAINAGSTSSFPALDFAGFARYISSAPDAGAYEYGAS